jgi:hypothetical protein
VSGKISNALSKLSYATKKLRFESLVFSIPTHTASFSLKSKKRKTTISRLSNAPNLVASSPLNNLLDTIEAFVDTERKRAIGRRDWGTAVRAALVQDYVRQSRRKN